MRRLLLASIHDVSPRFEGEVDRLLEMLRPFVGARIAMLVVPNHWGDAPVVPGSAFAARLRAWSNGGCEIFLHGFFHRDEARHQGRNRFRAAVMTADEGEFLGLTRTEAAERIGNGRKLLEDITGKEIAGFIAPAWLYGRGALAALEECGVPLAEDHWSVWSPATGAKLASGPVVTWASRTRMRLASSLVAAAALRWSPQDVLRIGVHPSDCRHSTIMKSIEKTMQVAARNRRAGRYADLQLAAD